MNIALEKAAKNNEFKSKYVQMKEDNVSLQVRVDLLSEDLKSKQLKVQELENDLELKTKEISTFQSSKRDLLIKLETIQK